MLACRAESQTAESEGNVKGHNKRFDQVRQGKSGVRQVHLCLLWTWVGLAQWAGTARGLAARLRPPASHRGGGCSGGAGRSRLCRRRRRCRRVWAGQAGGQASEQPDEVAGEGAGALRVALALHRQLLQVIREDLCLRVGWGVVWHGGVGGIGGKGLGAIGRA